MRTALTGGAGFIGKALRHPRLDEALASILK